MAKEKRPPIVTVLGHVDHGKTSLLDYIRKTAVQSKEAGGITQGIGASVVETSKGDEITFIDTPGHAAFGAMRSRGTSAADIVVLVVAANEGVKPQTSEAIKLIKESKVPFVVALTKTDLPEADSKNTLASLEKEELAFEGRGGDTSFVEVSVKDGKGVEDLLEIIALIAEIEEIKGDRESGLTAIVIETAKEKAGPTVNVVVKVGRLAVGEKIYVGETEVKVRALFNHLQKSTKEILPGYPAKVLGFSFLPDVGSIVKNKAEKKASQVNEKKKVEIEENQIPVIIKSSNAGFVEAVLGSLPEYAVVVESGVGEVTEKDILMAKTSNAIVYALDTKVDKQTKKLAETEGVNIKEHKIIYELFDDLKEVRELSQTKITGRADILDTFPFNKKIVAGGKVTEGKLVAGGKVVVFSAQGEELGEAKIISLRRGKEEIKEAKQGEEFGLILAPQLDFGAGDMILSVEK